MIEHGIIIQIKDGVAVVEMARTARCGRCCACTLGQGGRMTLEVDAPGDAQVGEEVDVEIPTSMTAAILKIFVFPLTALLLGMILGNWLAGKYFPDGRYRNLLPIAVALVFVIVTFGVVASVEKKSARRPSGRPRIVGRTS